MSGVIPLLFRAEGQLHLNLTVHRRLKISLFCAVTPYSLVGRQVPLFWINVPLICTVKMQAVCFFEPRVLA
jgi:hypothetical protein